MRAAGVGSPPGPGALRRGQAATCLQRELHLWCSQPWPGQTTLLSVQKGNSQFSYPTRLYHPDVCYSSWPRSLGLGTLGNMSNENHTIPLDRLGSSLPKQGAARDLLFSVCSSDCKIGQSLEFMSVLNKQPCFQQDSVGMVKCTPSPPSPEHNSVAPACCCVAGTQRDA